MLGTEYKWLLAPVRSATGSPARLARRSLLTLAVASFCLICVFAVPAPTLAPGVTVTAPVIASLDQAQEELPHVVVRLWLLLPQFLPGRH